MIRVPNGRVRLPQQIEERVQDIRRTDGCERARSRYGERTAAAHGLGIAHKPVTPSQLGRVLAQQLNPAA